MSDLTQASAHYDAEYFDWQKNVGAFGGRANAHKFSRWIKPDDIHFVVPCDSIRMKYRPGDINHHLFSWSPMNLGNLFTEAGFVVDSVRPHPDKWPRYYRQIASVGWPIFRLICGVDGRLERSWFEVEIKATRPAA